MDPFLRLTADNLYTRFGDHLSDIAVIFPNNRAKLFFSEHLYRIAGKPVWTPSFLTINDLFSSHSRLKVADTFTLVAHLYGVYLLESNKSESFDEFYLWGELLLSDFDDVDKNLADATQLFRNIKEQAAYTDTLEHLTDEQVASIRRFFRNFDPNRKTELKQRFIENWNILMQVYTGFRELLETHGLAYEGMLNRQVIDRLKSEDSTGFHFDNYAFIGFNVLNRCEQELFRYLQNAGKALFYWDYDISYMQFKEHEAGRFMRQNLEQFPNELDKSLFDNFNTRSRQIRFIASSSENAQARYLPDWINTLGSDLRPEETAVVLCNEQLLLPVLHSVPDSIRELNVTMGFPLNQAPISNLIIRICQLHASGLFKGEFQHFNYRYVLPVLQHPLIRMVSPASVPLEQTIRTGSIFKPAASDLQRDALLKTIFTPADNTLALSSLLTDMLTQLARFRPVSEPTEKSISHLNQTRITTDQSLTDDPLFQESVFRCFTLITRLKDALSESVVSLNMPVFQALLQKMIAVTSIPFSGEPVRGMQIMGMLETRTLDFKNLMVLSVNEGMLPKTGTDVSFIPYNLRKGFGLTTSEHKDSIFAYYFFRLLQRAETITLVYNTSTEGLNRGEMSRFMLQLLVESPHPISHFNLHANLGFSQPRSLQIDKSPGILRFLRQQYNISQTGKVLSPTSLNTLIDCSLKFYFNYVAGLKEKDEISDEIDGAMLGTFFHHAAEYLYTDILLRKSGQESNQVIIESCRQHKTINQALQNKGLSGQITTTDLEPWIRGPFSAEKLAEHVMRTDFFQLPPDSDKTPEYNGEQLIRLKLLTSFIKTLVRLDSERTPFELTGLETEVVEKLDINTTEGPLTVRIGGTIDRTDRQGDVLTVIDYKTGGKPVEPKTIDELFRQQEKRGSYIFQIFMYSAMLQRKHPSLKVTPQILYINMAGSDEYSPFITIGSGKEKTVISDYGFYDQAFREGISNLIASLFDPENPFVQTSEPKRCEYCSYKAICRR